MPVPSDQHHRAVGGPHGDYPVHQPGCIGRGRYPPDGPLAVSSSCFEYQNTAAIRNVVNIKKETLRVEPDEENPGRFLVSFFFDASVAGSITIFFFAKEGAECSLTATKEDLLQPVTVSFKEGLGQKFRQSSGTGIDFSMFDETELAKEGEEGIYPLAIKAEACPSNSEGPVGEDQKLEIPQSQITQALFKRKANGDYRILVVKQILWVNQTKYELQDSAIIKQNNAQLQLLVQIAESLRDIQADLKIIIEQTKGGISPNILPEDLINKLQSLTLGESKKPREGRGTLRVFKDPYKILKEEQEKLKMKPNEWIK